MLNKHQLRDALLRASGNVTRAARALGLSRMHVHRLTKLYALEDYALDLRLKAGGAPTGRPRAGL